MALQTSECLGTPYPSKSPSPLPPVSASPNPASRSVSRGRSPVSHYGTTGGNSRSASAFSMNSEGASTAQFSTTTAIKCEVMVQYLRQRQIEKLWSDGNVTEGVVLKRAKNDFVCQPAELSKQALGFYDEVRKLNVKVFNPKHLVIYA